MNRKAPVVVFTLLVFMVASLLSVSVLSGPPISGEHPWTSDRTGDTGDIKQDAIGAESDTLTVLQDQGDTSGGGEDSTANTLIDITVQMVSMIAWML